jgi:prepilin peptidase CpaA
MWWHEFLLAGLIAALALLLLSAGIEDIRRREIANWKNATIALAAPVWWYANGLAPWPDMAIQVALSAIVLVAFYGAFALGWMGGGDVKLIAALALWLPTGAFVSMLMVMSIAGGVVTLAMLIERALRKDRERIEVPYGVAIVFAALLSVRAPNFNQFL